MPQNIDSIRSVNYFISDISNLKSLKTKNLKKISLPEGILKVDNPLESSYAEFEIESPFSFNELICSLSAQISEKDIIETYIEFNGEEYSCGRFSINNSESKAKVTNDAVMDTDILKINKKANKFKVKINIYNNSGSINTIKLINIVLTDNTIPYNEKSEKSYFKELILPVPPISQMIQQVNYSGDICSPTSLAMIFSYYGINEKPADIAIKLIDNSNGIYGNWIFNTLYASYKGFYSFVVRINSVEEVYEYLKKGIPIIASITFGPDELTGSPIRKTKGHLLVVKGIDKNGNFIVNDPAGADNKKVEIIYDRKEFLNAWFKNKFGTAYIITDNIYNFISAQIPYSELFSINSENGNKQVETQILPDEKIKFIKKDNYISVELQEQKTTDKNNKEVNYSGYIDKYNFNLPLSYNGVIVNKNVETYDYNFNVDTKISMGTKVLIISSIRKGNKDLLLVQIGSKLFYVKSSDVNYFSDIEKMDNLRSKIIERAKQFIGDDYYLGGRSSSTVDCSGLVNLVYRTIGIDLPRNAKDQFLKANKIKIEDLKIGDLIFSTGIKSKVINHVMIYSGNGNIIESTQDSYSVREISLKEKFGIDFSKMRNGISTPDGRKIYFGRFISEKKSITKSKSKVNKIRRK